MKFMFEKLTNLFYFNLFVYCVLYTITLFTNKFILSTLKFTYPTVFQGWHTLVASLFLYLMKFFSKEHLKHSLHSHGIITMIPNIVFYVCSIVAGSKALSITPISIFLGTSNITNIAVLLSLNKAVNKTHFMSGCVTIIMSIILIFLQQLKMPDFSNVWLFTHIFFIVADILYSDFMDLKIGSMKKLWYINFFSVLILAPASLYLQEAFSALEFALSNQLMFYICVFISGVCGGMTQIMSLSLDKYRFSQSCAITLACLLSEIVFIKDALTSHFLLILIINLVSNNIFSFYNSLEKGHGELLIV